MASRSKRVTFLSKKTKPAHNSTIAEKVKVRQHAVEKLGVEEPMVLDLYAGPGLMWKKAYGETSRYLGLDQEQYDDKRRTIVCNNQRYLRTDRALDRFDIFDLDAYGSCAYQLATLAEMLKPLRKPIAVVLTDGCGFNSKMSSQPMGMLKYLGLKKIRGSFEKDHRHTFVKMMIQRTAERMTAAVRDCLFCEAKPSGGNSMYYISYVLEPVQVSSSQAE